MKLPNGDWYLVVPVRNGWCVVNDKRTGELVWSFVPHPMVKGKLLISKADGGEGK